MFGVIMPLCNRMFCCIFGWYFYNEIRLKYEKNILLFSSRAFSLSTPTFSLSTPVDNSEATWKKATKCNKIHFSKTDFRAKIYSQLTFVLKTPVTLKKNKEAWKKYILLIMCLFLRCSWILAWIGKWSYKSCLVTCNKLTRKA